MTMRLFVAIELPTPVREKLGQLLGALEGSTPSAVRWVQPNGLHITLKFLGEIETQRVSDLHQGMEEAVVEQRPFHLSLEHLGGFPDLRRPRVIWIGLMGELEQLQALQRRLEANLARRSFHPEAREFVPHLTLGRVKGEPWGTGWAGLERTIGQAAVPQDMGFQVEAISLMESTLHPSGAVYRRVLQSSFCNPLSGAGE